MIASVMHKGSGLGNQLHRYVAVRSLAKNKGYDFGVINPNNFKGSSFMKLDIPLSASVPEGSTFISNPQGVEMDIWNEKKILNEQGNDVRQYDETILDVKDNTIVDGEMQDERYFDINDVRDWLKVEPLEMPDNVCIINFRGGEYVGVKDLFLPQIYWLDAVMEMKDINPDMVFEVHTDDPFTAEKFFPNYVIIKDIGLNWRSIRYAKYLILSNSSFAILPALMNENVETIIAPRYWAGYNKGYWQLPQNYYKKFQYI